jgi:hypothetical protein
VRRDAVRDELDTDLALGDAVENTSEAVTDTVGDVTSTLGDTTDSLLPGDGQ